MRTPTLRATLLVLTALPALLTAQSVPIRVTPLSPLPLVPQLNAVRIDARHAIAVGEYGVIVRSDDGGATWNPAASGVSSPMRGVALTDADRAGWLRTLAMELVHHPLGMVLTCSALKSAYRDSLRCATPNLYFVHLAITEEEALRRVSQRAGHFYPASLVASQFEALEDPSTEAGVLVLNGNSVKDQAVTAVAWLNARSHTL